MATDIFEFPMGEGRLHAAIRDLRHRGLLGWVINEHPDAELVVASMPS